MDGEKLKGDAELVVRVGVNIQAWQDVIISA